MKIASVRPLFYERYEDTVNLVYELTITETLQKPKTLKRYIEMDANANDIEADVMAEFGCDQVLIQHCFYCPAYDRMTFGWELRY